MNLHGRSDLELARTDTASTALDLDQSEGPLQLVDLASGLVVMEVPPGKRLIKLALPAGRYLIRKQTGQGNYAEEIAIEAGATATVHEKDLSAFDLLFQGPKGSGTEPTTGVQTSLEPADSRGRYGGLAIAVLVGHTFTSFSGFDIGPWRTNEPDASVWEATLRLGWAFPPLEIAELFRPVTSVFAEARFGIADWLNVAHPLFERAFLVRVQENLVRTDYADLYANVGFGQRHDDVDDCSQLSCDQAELRIAAGVEGHLTEHFHLFLEPDFSAVGRGTTAFRGGFLWR
jgi:hypothetical protein